MPVVRDSRSFCRGQCLPSTSLRRPAGRPSRVCYSPARSAFTQPVPLHPMALPSLRALNRWSPGIGMPADELHVLIADDSSQHTEELVNTLRTAGYAVRPRFVQDREELDEALADQHWDLLLSHPFVGDMDVPLLCARAREADQDGAIVVVAMDDPERLRSVALPSGARDVVRRGDETHLLAIVGRELDRLAVERRYDALQRRAHEAERRCMTLLDSSRDALAYVHDGMHVYANATYLGLFGYREEDGEDIAGLPLLDLVAPEDAGALRTAMRTMTGSNADEARTLGELTGVRSDGGRITLSMQLAGAVYDGERCILVTARDLAERKEFERQLHHMRRRDPATGLFNNHHMREQLQRLGSAASAGVGSGFVLAEVDGFEAIRRTVGIGLTTDIIRDVARVVGAEIGDKDVLARMNEQTFAIALPRRAQASTLELAERVRAAVENHIWEHAEHSVATTCSVGAVVLTAERPDPAVALALADRAVESASRGGGNQVVFGQPEVVPAKENIARTSADLELTHVLDALDAGRAQVLYQPIVHLAGEASEIYEVSLSIRDPAGQTHDGVAVRAALDRADHDGMAEKWLLRTALATVGPLNERGRGLKIFVRLSPSTLLNREALSELGRAVLASGLAPGTVTFELPLSIARQQIKSAKQAAHGLRAATCRVALREFGLDRSDFTLLSHIDAHYLMLAPELLEDVATDHEAAERLTTLAERARQAGKAAIATAVRDAHALTVLWRCGIPYAHGDYIQEPSRELSYDFVDG